MERARLSNNWTNLKKAWRASEIAFEILVNTSDPDDIDSDGNGMNPIKFVFKKNGAIYFSRSDTDGFIYLYPDQVAVLKALLLANVKSVERA